MFSLSYESPTVNFVPLVVHIFLFLLVIVFCSEVDNHFPDPSTIVISSSVSPYNSYTSLSIAASAASICRDSSVFSWSRVASCNFLFKSSIWVTSAIMRSWWALKTYAISVKTLYIIDRFYFSSEQLLQ